MREVVVNNLNLWSLMFCFGSHICSDYADWEDSVGSFWWTCAGASFATICWGETSFYRTNLSFTLFNLLALYWLSCKFWVYQFIYNVLCRLLRRPVLTYCQMCCVNTSIIYLKTTQDFIRIARYDWTMIGLYTNVRTMIVNASDMHLLAVQLDGWHGMS